MRKLWILVVSLIGLGYAQNGNHIHHLFGLKEDVPGLLTLSALNQQNGQSVDIETYTSGFSAGGTYAYFTVNNRVFYIDTVNPNFSVASNYDLPELYTTNYAGNVGSTTFQSNVSSICTNPQADSLLYAFDFTTKQISALGLAGGFIANGATLSGLLDESSLSQVFFQNSIYIASNNNLNEVAMNRVDANNLFNVDTLTYPFQSMYMVADPQIGIFAVARNAAQQNYLLQLSPTSTFIDTIALLPSCTNCGVEEFNYDKNALAIDSDNGHLILSRSQNVPASGLQFFLSTYDLITGNEIYNVQTQAQWSNLIFQKPLADLVYPGDTDHDKLANMLDILPIGIKYNDQVVDRFEISTEWIGQLAANTGDTLLNGVDKKHADCNGDGQINAVDIDAIFENYASIHYSEKSTNANCDFPVYLQFPALVKEDEPVEIQIGLDLSSNLIQDVYGLVFTLEYDNGFVDSSGISIQGGSTWFGTENGDYVQRSYQEESGRLAVGVVGIDQLNREGGGGVLLNGVWTMEDVVIPIAQGYSEMDIRITNVRLIDLEQNILDACGVDTTIRVYDKNVGIKERTNQTLPLHPNPSKQNFINLSDIDQLDLVEMYDIQGRMIKTWNTNFDHLFMGDIPKGIYVVKAYADEKMFVNKLIYAKE